MHRSRGAAGDLPLTSATVAEWPGVPRKTSTSTHRSDAVSAARSSGKHTLDDDPCRRVLADTGWSMITEIGRSPGPRRGPSGIGTVTATVGSLVVVRPSSLPFPSALGPLVAEPPFSSRPGWSCLPPRWRRRSQRRVEEIVEAGSRDLAVAPLGPGVVHDDRHDTPRRLITQSTEDSVLRGGIERPGGRDVESQLRSARGAIGVLSSGPAAGREPPLELVVRDVGHQPPSCRSLAASRIPEAAATWVCDPP